MQFSDANRDFSEREKSGDFGDKRDEKNEIEDCVDGDVCKKFKEAGENSNCNDLCDFAFEERALAFFAEFAAGAGHEINNPLAIISGRAQELLREETSPKKRRELATIIEQTNRAFEMIADIRLFARPPKPAFSEFSLKTFFQDWVEREKKRIEELGAPIETRICAEFNDIDEIKSGAPSEFNDAIVKSDPEMLAAIMRALGKNAVEAVANGGRLAFFCEVGEVGEVGEVERGVKFGIIGVENEGPELSAETRRLIFSPFFSGRQAGRGLGFGLPKSWRYADALGASLRCEKTKLFDSGTRCSVVLPIR